MHILKANLYENIQCVNIKKKLYGNFHAKFAFYKTAVTLYLLNALLKASAMYRNQYPIIGHCLWTNKIIFY